MKTFDNIKELLSTLKREEKLISEMFEKRKKYNFKSSDALALVDEKEGRITFLLDRGVIRENDGLLELGDQFLDFFEQILDINEEINVSYVNDNVKSIKEHITYYLNEDNENGKYGYLKSIKRGFRKLDTMTFKSVADLRRNIEDTFKNEPNYKIKKQKLENLDEKRNTIYDLIEKTSLLIDEEELTFFNKATDEELKTIIINLKHCIKKCDNNLIEIQTQIINYLDQIKPQGSFLKQLRKLKYLKDHFRDKAETDIQEVLAEKNQVIFESSIKAPIKLSIDYLRNDEQAHLTILKNAEKHRSKRLSKPMVADNISEELLENSIEEEIMIDLEKVKNEFIPTSDDLFNFIFNYNFSKKLDFDERVTICCQIISEYKSELTITDEFETNNNIEYALVYPK